MRHVQSSSDCPTCGVELNKARITAAIRSVLLRGLRDGGSADWWGARGEVKGAGGVHAYLLVGAFVLYFNCPIFQYLFYL